MPSVARRTFRDRLTREQLGRLKDIKAGVSHGVKIVAEHAYKQADTRMRQAGVQSSWLDADKLNRPQVLRPVLHIAVGGTLAIGQDVGLPAHVGMPGNVALLQVKLKTAPVGGNTVIVFRTLLGVLGSVTVREGAKSATSPGTGSIREGDDVYVDVDASTTATAPGADMTASIHTEAAAQVGARPT
jgi:hypothetical protein